MSEEAELRRSSQLSGQSRQSIEGNDERQLLSLGEEQHQHLETVRERAAERVVRRAITKAQSINGVKIGVVLTLSKDSNAIRHVVTKIKYMLLRESFLFAVAPSGPYTGSWPLVLIGSSPDIVDKAATLTCAKFLGRLREIQSQGEQWLGYIEDIGSSNSDEAMLWDIVRKSPHVLNPKTPPSGSRSAARLIEAARVRLERITPKQALDELHDLTFVLPVVIVDIRPTQQREMYGEIPNSLIVERTSLEWKFDPRSDEHLSIADRYDLRVIIVDQDGRASSLAAASLHDLGLLNATDIIGGFDAWKSAGLPTFLQPPPPSTVSV